MQPGASTRDEIDRLCREGRHAEALRLCEAAQATDPGAAELFTIASQLHQHAGRFDRMLEAALRAQALLPRHVGVAQRVAEACVYAGRVDRARQVLQQIETWPELDALQLQRVAELRLHCADVGGALRCQERALALAGAGSARRAPLLFNAASSQVMLGQVGRAEALLDEALALDPADFGAHHQRAMLRRWSREEHHVDELTRLLACLPADHAGRVPLGFALAKELEDLGDDAASMRQLQTAAALRRGRMAYRVESDVEAMDAIRTLFDERCLARRAQAPAEAGSVPWFVLGLPRSGTTLVERILGSHDALASLGEVDCLAFSLLQIVGAGGGKPAMIRRSTQVDVDLLGRLYRSATASYGVPAQGLIDKTPANFLYLGLIHGALPQARVVHVRRHPLDSCLAMYKTLFRMGYPFSYSLKDLGHYYLAYHRLMAHWRALVPNSFIDLDYDALVANQQASTERLLAYGNLPWQDACLQFHRNSTPSATASASQVREPIHQRSSGRWRVHSGMLAGLAAFLESYGVDCS
jgi:tetratricopeptide (TPR) repeat protein